MELAATGPDECWWCTRAGTPEVEYYCACCDRAVCAACVVLVGTPAEPRCHACCEDEEEEGKGG